MSNRRWLFSTQIEPAIRSKSCPICLTRIINPAQAAVLKPCLHAYCVGCIERWSGLKRKCPLCNSRFDAWFCNIDLGYATFFERRLPNQCTSSYSSRFRSVRHVQRVVRRLREEFNYSNQRSRPLPRRRTFGKPGPENSDAVAQRILRWRSSVYEQRLRAVPHFCQTGVPLTTTTNNAVKESISRRIEPWIHRELKAILGDPDPSIIVHVASSLFISSLDAHPNQSVLDDNHLEPLRPFLHELTNMFWHELRCFAGSPFNMETYDTVVEYRERRE